MHHEQNWTDLYGSVCASFAGRAGGHRWLVAAPPDLAASVPGELQALDGKGHVRLLVYDGLTPLLAALREWSPRGVLVVAPRALSAGPALSLPLRTVTIDGTSYQEGGEFPVWHSALSSDAPAGENAAASAAASLGCPVVVTGPGEVRVTLEQWLGQTPHGR